MINVTQEYLNAVSHYQRSIITRVYFNGSETPIQNSELIRVQVKELGQSTDALTLGDLCTNEATVKFVMPNPRIPLEGGYFRLEHGILVGSDYEYIPLGTFYISQIESIEGSGIYTITGYDRSKRLEVEYKPTVTLPTTVGEIVRDVCTQCNIVLDDTASFPNYEISELYSGTCKETIKYMAGLMGKNAKINRNDKLAFYWFKNIENDGTSATLGQLILGQGLLGSDTTNTSKTYYISKGLQYMSGFKRTTSEDITVQSITSGTEEVPLVSGVGRGIKFVNPYMTQAILDEIYEVVKGFTYTPNTTKYNGNPAIEIGDVVLVQDKEGLYHNAIVSGHDLVLTGMNATISSKGTTDENIAMQQSPTEIKLNKWYGELTNQFKNSTELITGAKGGYFVIDKDENGYPTGFKIMDTPTLTDNTKLWIFNKNGLGFSEDGGTTLKNVAIDMLGNINANSISTGVIQGDFFELNLATGTMTLGLRGTNGNFVEEWFKVDNSGLSMTIPSNSGLATLDDIKKLNTKIDDNQTTLTDNIEFNVDGGGIRLGRGDFRVTITEQELYFEQSGVKVAYISNNKLYITHGQFTESMAMGKDELIVYEWVVRSNKHLTLRIKEGSGS